MIVKDGEGDIGLAVAAWTEKGVCKFLHFPLWPFSALVKCDNIFLN